MVGDKWAPSHTSQYVPGPSWGQRLNLSAVTLSCKNLGKSQPSKYRAPRSVQKGNAPLGMAFQSLGALSDMRLGPLSVEAVINSSHHSHHPY